MSDPRFAIQIALVTRIAELAAELNGRVYDDVPPFDSRVADTGAGFPYVSLGDGQISPIDEECFERTTNFFYVNVWSRAVGFPESARIAGVIRVGLHEKDLVIEGHVLDGLRVESVNYLRDPDGLTRRARLELAVDTQPAS
ncbi:DUF3168 domain-containing protein (plasmid) [Agrobacterium rosae]|uniref:DUF3168 domain-containing protein n=1 Tax=Agrobacterium rosae TaxID=1972867 RepID=A0ABU4W817_9HYPH|nr:DUF3168 domain-containing protein [Agrobacterium rosae]MDX8332895.1 DUF3168 domain-containing protein [Agrobacterium rosae]